MKTKYERMRIRGETIADIAPKEQTIVNLSGKKTLI